MSFKVGDRVRVNSPGSEYHNATGQVVNEQRTSVNLDSHPASITALNSRLKLIPPTTEQLVEMLVEAGYRADGNGKEYLGLIQNKLLTVSIETFVVDYDNDYGRVPFKCKDLDSAVKLALTLVEVCK